MDLYLQRKYSGDRGNQVSIIDSGLELLPFEQHVGSDIGGVAPTNYGSRLVPGGWLEFYTNGPSYADWLGAIHRPVCSYGPVANLSLAFDLCVDPSTDVQCREIDTIVSLAGMKYNQSAQFNEAANQFQIVDKNGVWINPGWSPGKLAPLSPNAPMISTPVQFNYSFDFANKVSSFLSAAATTWADRCSLQVQLDIAGAPGLFAMWMRNVRYEWS